ncbi:hypothetical protein DM867_08975 [Halosegnis rubeus]|jgi:membrane-bound metal-dependent hydrolase YbcI (DUF457 family)|uniref:DUF5658 domain-containing protein n=1 Tax=Halosegnis rubeus TaxID=2212850 RepID=A0A5N5U5U1_9EURY|nr:hypothetical protein [Halosegnis rubeus]KAB7513914.1 hypothetical protein DM867_08975 [Halosegnis rubeus]KAB7518772.1 hypothetical protein DP108_06285 [Halosegnis rubeus]
MEPDQLEEWTDDYWSWVAVVLFLLIPVDLLTTAGAATIYGTQAETNPLMRWLLTRRLATIVAVHLAVLVAVVVSFRVMVFLLETTDERHQRAFAYGIEAFVGLLLLAGLVVFANNLSVIVLGESLL